MIDYYIREYIAICDYLNKINAKSTLEHLIVKKDFLVELLDKNKFDTAQNKLKIWKRLHWIDSDQDRLTKRIYDPEAKKYVAYIKIYKQVYDVLKDLENS